MTAPTPPMSAEQVAEIRARVDAATEGPWTPADDHGDPTVLAGRLEHVIDWNWGGIDGRKQGFADAEFIAHARTDVPALLAEVERLREELRLSEGEREDLDTGVGVLLGENVELEARLREAEEAAQIMVSKAGEAIARAEAAEAAVARGVRLTEEEKSYGRSDPGLQWRGRWYSEASVERILAARLRAATEGKGEA